MVSCWLQRHTLPENLKFRANSSRWASQDSSEHLRLVAVALRSAGKCPSRVAGKGDDSNITYTIYYDDYFLCTSNAGIIG